jgi:hypothetical protein
MGIKATDWIEDLFLFYSLLFAGLLKPIYIYIYIYIYISSEASNYFVEAIVITESKL